MNKWPLICQPFRLLFALLTAIATMVLITSALIHANQRVALY